MFDPRMLGQFGRNGDTLIAHISPQEAEILKLLGGSGTINPETGLPEFYAGDNGESDANGGDPGGFGGPADGMGDFGGGVDSFGVSEGVGIDNASGYGPGTDNFAGTLGPTDLSSILSDMEANAEYNQGISDTNPKNIIELPHPRNSFLQNMGDKAISGWTNFKNDPIGFLTPSWSTVGRTAGMMALGPIGALAGWGIGSLADKYDFTTPSDEDLAMVNQEEGNHQGNYTELAQNMVSGTSGVSQAQSEIQPSSNQSFDQSFDRNAFGQFGQGLISSQGKSQQSNTKSDSARRGLGTDSGQIMGQLAIQRQQQQNNMRQFNQMMSNPNMGYNDLAASLMNIMA